MFLAAFTAPATARGDDLDEVLLARDLYANTEYEAAIERFQHFVNRQPPPSPQYIEIARRYVVASYLLTNHREDAVRLLEQMLRENPDLQFSTRDFSGVVTQLVDETRGRMSIELDRIRREQRERLEREAAERRRRNDLLLARLGQVPVTYEVSRAWMFIPGGVGQWVNRQYAWGALFTSLEVASVITGVATYAALMNLGLPNVDPSGTQCRASACTGLIVANVAAWSVLGAAIVAGVIQANVAFVPERTTYRTRPVPPDVRRLLISGGPTENGVILGVTLRF